MLLPDSVHYKPYPSSSNAFLLRRTVGNPKAGKKGRLAAAPRRPTEGAKRYKNSVKQHFFSVRGQYAGKEPLNKIADNGIFVLGFVFFTS